MHWSWSYKLHIASLILFFVHSSTTQLPHPKCDDTLGTPQCKCYAGKRNIVWTCGRTDIDSISFTIEHNNLHLNCFGRDPNTFSQLPKIGQMERLVTKDCSALMSIQNILQIVEITAIVDLEFRNGNLTETLQSNYFKSFVGLIYLKLDHMRFTKLENNSFGSMKNLQWLAIRNDTIENLPSGVFNGLEKLVILDLSFNHLQVLPPGIFRDQKKLGWLKLNDNNISSLSKDMFKGLSVMGTLDLRNNKLVTLEPDVFAHLTYLRHVNFVGNYFQSLPFDLFKENRRLESFNFVNSNDYEVLKDLPAKFLSNFPFLGFVDIQTGLRSISPTVFEKSSLIWYINIGHTHLTELPSTLFADQHRLASVDLSFNKLTGLPDDIFRYNIELDTVRLSYNRLENVSSKTFAPLSRLRYLYMDNNNLINISPDSVLSAKSIEQLFMSNPLKTWDLRNNSIRSIDFGVMYSRRSNSRNCTIELSHNPFHCDCDGMNSIKMFNEHEDGLKINIDKLQCDSPEILKRRFVPQLLAKNLTYPLDAEETSQKLCPDGCLCWATCFDKLLKVDCSNGGFSEVPLLPSIDSIDLQGTELHMENNKLIELPTSKTMGYDDVVELHVANNSLTAISVDNLPNSIRLLNLSSNNLQGLGASLIQVLSVKDIRVSLSNKPWLCDCSTQQISKFVDENSELILDLKDMKCTSGQHFQDLVYDFFCLNGHSLIVVISIILIVICFVLLIVLYFKDKRELKMWLYAHNMMLWIAAEEVIGEDKKYDAFLWYWQRDEEFITDHLLPGLEHGPKAFIICLPVRDIVSGEFIPRYVSESCRTIIVLSESCIESLLAVKELKDIHAAALSKGPAKVIVIRYGDVGNIDSLDHELKTYLQANTCVKWGEPWFWDRLRYVMPHRSIGRSSIAHEAVDNRQLELSDLRVVPC